jgi:hypothetical protein
MNIERIAYEALSCHVTKKPQEHCFKKQKICVTRCRVSLTAKLRPNI